jgi:hypothetical protein
MFLFLPKMKPLFFILSLYLICMSCIPCNDNNECNVKEKVSLSSSPNHLCHNHTKESCTPFCSCSCCTASTFYSQLTKTPDSKITFQNEKFPLRNEFLITEAYFSIWQPPKLQA